MFLMINNTKHIIFLLIKNTIVIKLNRFYKIYDLLKKLKKIFQIKS
jgi:hypothetical protein